MLIGKPYYAAIMCGVSAVALFGGARASAQDVDQATPQGTPADEIVVTGTQIRGSRINGALPVSILNRDDIRAIGGVSGEDLYRSLPLAGVVGFNTQTLNGGNQGSARGDVSSINLRGLGPGYTLVLINGRRTVPYGSSQGNQELTYNANAIPIFGLERLEVLRDGAAALYGSDAVAGVVNNVLKTDFEGLETEIQFGNAEGTNLKQLQVNAKWGKSIQDGRGNISTFFNFGLDTKLYARDQEFTKSNDKRMLVSGTGFENSPAFDTRSPSSPFGGFAVLNGPGVILSNGTPVTNDSGQFHIQPSTNAGCQFNLGGSICIDDGLINNPDDFNLKYDASLAIKNLTVTPSIKRFNFFTFVNYDISDDVSFFGEAGYYRSKTESVTLPVGPLGSTPVIIPASNYYNPFGPITSPNRLPGLNIPDTGLPVRILSYLTADVGERIVNVESEQLRTLIGFRGQKFGWDWETAGLYTVSTADDVSDGIQTSLWQAALGRSTQDAYNPFNGGDPINPSLGDVTLSEDLTSYAIKVNRYGRKALALWDLKLSNPEIFKLPGGGIGAAIGVEVRREKSVDDREDTGDFSTPFVDMVTGAVFDSDTLGSSAAYDLEGKRTVYSAFAELSIPLIGPEMNVPMFRAIDLQTAARVEKYSDVGSVVKPKFAGSWDLIDGVRLRASWQQGFKAPNLEQLAPVDRPVVGTWRDDIKCEADLRAGRIASFSACTQFYSTQRITSGNLELKPEESESLTYGVVLQPVFLPPNLGNLILTFDHWKIEQKGIVDIPSVENALALDYLLRVEGSANPNIVRAAPTASDIAFVAGTGLDPIGTLLTVNTSYENLSVRSIKGFDIGLSYDLNNTPLGDFNVNLNGSRTLKFFQTPSPLQQQLLEAQAAGTINSGVTIGGAADLLEDAGFPIFFSAGGGPKWKWSALVGWHLENWGAGASVNYTGRVFQKNARNSQNEFWEVESQMTVGLYGEYTFKNNFLADTNIRLGVRNITDEKPPLATFGYLGTLYQPYGRYWYANIRKEF